VLTDQVADTLTGTHATGVVSTLVEEQIRQEDPQRQRRLSPTERRRLRRQACVTFSTPDLVERLRALADRWGWRAGNSRPNVSRVVEYLILPRLEAAERGELDPKPQPLPGGEQWL